MSKIILITGLSPSTCFKPSADACTGANSGVGFATADVIASASPDYHVLVAARSLAGAEEAIKTIKESGAQGTLTPIQLDVTSRESIDAAADFVAKTFGRLDVLINNAGVANVDPDIVKRHQINFSTNVTGPVLMSIAFNPLLLKSEKPYSLFVTSEVGSLALAADPNSSVYRGPPNGETYRASKAALNMIVLQMLATRDPTDPIKIFAVCPGFVKSNLAGKGTERSRLRNAQAGDPKDSGRVLLSLVEGKRDAEEGKLVHKDGVYPW